ncbi:mediator complex, subunit Med11 [Chaetomium fimeti]|uniref:Mediator of RNA polymerase II transcription subunit 11 n=1 Tax=Chaetomium fimeti TaxID=1854472 RepID=A0AAE0HII4_9PEZI|nr:mediator complex, subunit Med11 [Chaetomium fimeti]
MDNPTQPPDLNGGAPIDIHKPFTSGERIQQLGEIDQDIASLLVHLSSAMRALATPPGTTVPQNTTTTNGHSPSDNNNNPSIPNSEEEEAAAAADPITAFNTAQSSFFNTVDRIDKHLTRQILALEEAGIITLRNSGAAAENQPGAEAGSGQQPQQQQQQQQQQAGGGESGGSGGRARAAGPARLEPDGMGRYGSLDVGKLNMASSTVERDMERELWRRAREELGKVVGEGLEEGGDGDRMQE